jgi:hypothetical protein
MNLSLFDYIAPVDEDRNGAARRTDPHTSHHTARTIRTGSQRHHVLTYLAGCGDHGATDYEIAVALGMLRGSAAKRRGELAEQQLVAASTTTRLTDTGHLAIVHHITPAGLDACHNTKEKQ